VDGDSTSKVGFTVLVARRRKGAKGQDGSAASSPQGVLVKALSHPVRVKALTILSEKVASPTEISELIEMPLGNVAYHVRVLDELGLVEVVEEEAVRGSVAHFYKAIERGLIDNSSWKSLDPRVRTAVSGYLLETLITDAADSLKAMLFDKRDDRHVSRTSLLLDEKGWHRVAEIHSKAHESVLKAQAAATERMKNSESEGIQATSGLLFFEVPPSADG
jgi:DNA-binding transcriptional ArsR family regulator